MEKINRKIVGENLAYCSKSTETQTSKVIKKEVPGDFREEWKLFTSFKFA